MSERPPTHALRVLLIAGVLFPVLTMLTVLALDTQQALRVVIAGVGIMALLTAWATSRQLAQPDHIGRNSTTHPQPTTDEESGSCTRTD